MVNPLAIEVPREFESERLSIRAPHIRDAADLNAAIRESLPELQPWMPWAQRTPSLHQTRANLRAACRKFLTREDFRYHIFLKGTETLVAASGLHRADWEVPKFEIGYWVRTPYAGRGYVTEAVVAIADMAFRRLGARRIQIRMNAENERSWRVAERAGFELEGILRNDCRHLDGTIRDTRVYSRVIPYP
jgi:RimJ/RimL family protein N-acetyltransferase